MHFSRVSPNLHTTSFCHTARRRGSTYTGPCDACIGGRVLGHDAAVGGFEHDEDVVRKQNKGKKRESKVDVKKQSRKRAKLPGTVAHRNIRRGGVPLSHVLSALPFVV